MRLEHFALFLEIVRKGSLAGAARELGLSPATVSERLAAIEAHYGTTLLHRTTRALHLTEEGRVVAEGARRVLEEAAQLETLVRIGSETLSGSIRMSAPVDLGHSTIAPVTDQFVATHPRISIELLLSDGYVDVVGEGIDIAIRFGHLTDSSLRVRSLGAHRRVVCAAPDYLKARGEPRTPSELANHNCLMMRFGPHLDNVWRFAEDQQVVVRGNRISSDSRLVHRWCVDGHGLAWKSVLDVGAELDSGALVELLSGFASDAVPLQMVFPPHRAQPPRVKALADALSQAFPKA